MAEKSLVLLSFASFYCQQACRYPVFASLLRWQAAVHLLSLRLLHELQGLLYCFPKQTWWRGRSSGFKQLLLFPMILLFAFLAFFNFLDALAWLAIKYSM
jgi:hypothetical protein